MKKIVVFSVLLLIGLTNNSNAQGVKFTKGTWKEVLAQAKASKKMVFVDIYTEWCGPCKWMVKNVFPDPKVGTTFNASFINYQIDAENGEGVELAQKYNVEGFPTLLFVDGNGKLVHKVMGAYPAPDLLKEVGKFLKKKKA